MGSVRLSFSNKIIYLQARGFSIEILVLHYTTSRKPVRCTGNLLKMKFVIYKKKLSKFVKLKMPNIYLANIHVDLCRALSGSVLLVILVS